MQTVHTLTGDGSAIHATGTATGVSLALKLPFHGDDKEQTTHG